MSIWRGRRQKTKEQKIYKALQSRPTKRIRLSLILNDSEAPFGQRKLEILNYSMWLYRNK